MDTQMNVNVRNTAIILATMFFPLQSAATLSNGYVLCGAYSAKTTILLDKTGSITYSWNHTTPNGYSVYLLENGNLLRTAQVGSEVPVPAGAGPLQGLIEEVDPRGNVVWSYQLADSVYCTHHDMKTMPNGNIIACAFELKTKEDMKAVGIDTSLLTGGGMGGGGRTMLAEMIFELKPDRSGGGNHEIVWEWHIWDHIIRKEQAPQHPELFSTDISNQVLMQQWVHLNGLDYCPRRDLIVFTSRLFSEVFIIDHSTTTAEAATHSGGTHGKGGDLLYRWGRPGNYLTSYDTVITPERIRIRTNGDTVRTPADTNITKKEHANDWVNVLHCCTFIPEGYPGGGNIMFFHNNSNYSTGVRNVSQVIELALPLDVNGRFIHSAGTPFSPDQPTWIYAPADSFHSPYMSSAIRMPNGNTIAHEASPTYGGGGGMFGSSTNSRLREITPEGNVIWSCYIEVPEDTGEEAMGFMAFNPPKIMYYPDGYKGVDSLRQRTGAFYRPPVRSENHALCIRPTMRFRAGHLVFDDVRGYRLSFYTPQGKVAASLRARTDRVLLPLRRFPAGTYLVGITNDKGAATFERVQILH